MRSGSPQTFWNCVWNVRGCAHPPGENVLHFHPLRLLKGLFCDPRKVKNCGCKESGADGEIEAVTPPGPCQAHAAPRLCRQKAVVHEHCSPPILPGLHLAELSPLFFQKPVGDFVVPDLNTPSKSFFKVFKVKMTLSLVIQMRYACQRGKK